MRHISGISTHKRPKKPLPTWRLNLWGRHGWTRTLEGSSRVDELKRWKKNATEEARVNSSSCRKLRISYYFRDPRHGGLVRGTIQRSGKALSGDMDNILKNVKTDMAVSHMTNTQKFSFHPILNGESDEE